MRRCAFLPCVLLALIGGGCASMENSGGHGDDTLASLGEELPIKIDKDAVILAARDKALEGYWEFMNSEPADSLRVEALRRLADLELERSEDQYQQQLEQLAQQKQSLDHDDRVELKGVDYKKAIKLYEQALKASERGGTDDPNVLYQLSKAYEQAGQSEKALQALNRLLSEFPDIKNRAEVHFRRGELYFHLKRYKEADVAYTQAMVVDPASQYYEKALSQRGWAAYKQNQYRKALFSFLGVADRKLRNTQNGGLDDSQLSRGEQELLNDTFRAIFLCFNELGGANAVTEYFAQNGERPYAPRIYKGLGDYYLQQGRIKDAAETYKAYVKRNPFNRHAPLFEQYAIDAYAKGGFASLTLQEKIAFAQRYRVNGPYWEHQTLEQQQKLLPLVAKNMEELARHYHAVAQKTQKPADYQQAYLWYRQFIKSFPKTQKAAELNFQLADALYENKQFEEAAKEYEITAYQYVKGGKNVEAGYAALQAYNELVKTLHGRRKQVFERVAVGSALRFGKTFPKDPRASQVLMKATEDLYALKKFDQATVAAKEVLEASGNITEKMRRTAWVILAQSELENGKFTESETAYKMALAMTKDDAQMRKTIQEGIAAAIYKRGEKMRAAGNTEAALAQFKRISKEAPHTQANVAAQFDMAANYMTRQDWQGAVNAFLQFRSKYPHHPLQSKVSENLVMAYVKLNQPLNAARELERILSSQPDLRQKQEVQWQIAQLYEQAKADDKMIAAYKRYVREYPQPVAQASEACNKLATAYKKMGNNSEYVHWLKEIIHLDTVAGAKNDGRAKYLAAKASFELAEPALKLYREVQLKAPLKANLAKKKRLMKSAVDAFTQAAGYGVEEVTTASVYLLGEIYGSFGRDLLHSERPPGLSPDELEQYDILLEEQAYPFEEKAITILESNIQRVKDGTYDEWVRKSFTALQKLRPVRYAKSEKSEMVVNAIY